MNQFECQRMKFVILVWSIVFTENPGTDCPGPNPAAYCSGMDFCLQWAELPDASLEQDRLLGELRLWGERPNAKEEARL